MVCSAEVDVVLRLVGEADDDGASAASDPVCGVEGGSRCPSCLDDDVGPFVFSPDNDSLLISVGGEIVWEDRERKMTLWKEPEG